MTPTEQIAAVLIEHSYDHEAGDCMCGYRVAAGAEGDLPVHVAEAIAVRIVRGAETIARIEALADNPETENRTGRGWSPVRVAGKKVVSVDRLRAAIRGDTR